MSRRHIPPTSRSRSVVVAPMLAGLLVLVVTAVVTVAILRNNTRLQGAADRRRVEDAVQLIDRRMDSDIDMLVGVRSFVNQVGPHDPVAFREFVRDLDVATRHPGVQVLGLAEVVEPELADQFVTEQRARRAELDGPVFEIHPPPSGEPVVAVTMVEPLDGNELAFGFDLASEPVRRTTLEQARDTGAVVASAPLRLVQETETQSAVIVVMPIYSSADIPATVVARRDRFVGVVVAAFRIGDLLEGVLGADAGLPGFAVYDTSDGTAAGLMHSVNTDPPDAIADEGSNLVGSLQVAGRTWTVQLGDTANFVLTAQRSRPIYVMAVGTLLALLVAAVVHSTRVSRLAVERLAAARRSELDALTAAASDAIITVGMDGRVTGWNAAAQRIFGYDEGEIRGRPLTDLMPPEAGERYGERFFRMVGGDDVPELEALAQQRTIEIMAVHQDGRRFPVELSLAQWAADGETHFTGFVRDVSDRQAAEARLRETTDLLTTVFGTVEIGLIATDGDGTIIAFNPGAERLVGYTADDIVGTHTPALFHDAVELAERAAELDLPAGFEVLVADARRGVTETRRWTYVRADGSRLPVELTVTALRDDASVTGFLGVAVDLTDRLAVERATENALERERHVVASLRELDAAKSEFVSTVSHELRTPLSSISGFTEMLLDDLTDDEQHRRSMLEAVERNAQRLLALVDDLLTVSQIEAGRFDFERVPVDIVSVVGDAVEAVNPLTRDKNLRLTIDVDGPAVTLGDSRHLERVVLNLLSNAIKATPTGGLIAVSVGVRHGFAVVTVADTGIGIPSDELRDLFTRFRRTSNSQRQAIQGTGLGLTIVRSIVDAHGGSIDVASTEGLGTTFTVRLPIADLRPAGRPDLIDNASEVHP